MTPAELIVHRFGGVGRLSALLDCHRTTVQKWLMPVSRQGTSGAIPRKRQTQILELARKKGVPLTLEEIVYGANRRRRV